MVKPKHIINDPVDSVDEFIQGLLLQYPTHLAKLQNHHVLLASKRDLSKVQLICGGGSGHEPSHAGFLGHGMLSAAVCGGLFASPSVASVLAAIRATATKKGVLLVMKNYTGDRLNFGMAAEKARQEGIPMETIVVADDCALERTKGITGARGVAGTVLVNKIAGAAAADGKSLSQVAAIARRVCSRMGSLGVSMDSVTVPGAESMNDRLDATTIEIGLGIHGEAGSRQSTPLTADQIAREMVAAIQSHGRQQLEDGTIVPVFQPGDEIAILVNNLGGTSNLEMSILTRSCVHLLESDEFGAKATRVLVGAFMTSFDMHGASLTILNLTNQDELSAYLDAATTAPAWTGCDVWKDGDARPSAMEIPEKKVDEDAVELTKPPLAINNFDKLAKTMTLAAAAKLGEAEPLLTKYDTIVGDGDCGLTMKRGATEVTSRLEKSEIPLDHPVTLLASLADAVSASMGGTSGVLLELMFRKMSSFLASCDSIGIQEMSLAVQAGVDAVCLYGGASVGSRTMLDALIPAASVLVESNDLSAAAAKAKEGAESTATMGAASAGRSNYLSEQVLSGTPDPGAVAVQIVLEALSDSLV